MQLGGETLWRKGGTVLTTPKPPNVTAAGKHLQILFVSAIAQREQVPRAHRCRDSIKRPRICWHRSLNHVPVSSQEGTVMAGWRCEDYKMGTTRFG